MCPTSPQSSAPLRSAKVQASERRRFAELGVMGVIAKPFDPLSLPREVSEVMGWNA